MEGSSPIGSSNICAIFDHASAHWSLDAEVTHSESHISTYALIVVMLT